MINASEEIKATIRMGNLPKFAWPGGYPLFYLDAGDNVLCQECANQNDDYCEPITAVDVNWEDPDLYCDQCSKTIEAAYESV